MSDILFATKKTLIDYNEYNQNNFDHGYDKDEFNVLSDKSAYPVTEIKNSRKDENHRVYQFLLNDKGKFCIFYLNKDKSDKLQSMKIPNNLIN
jgi:hypothetical protein|tara:strand:- start:4974 stop:5252 length:279 start_codon:yes stop_codon:yes gene_type:complete